MDRAGHVTIDDVRLQLADYCCRCGKLFTQHDPLSVIRTGEVDESRRDLARVVHRDFCVSPEDVVVMTGTWFYGGLMKIPDAKNRR